MENDIPQETQLNIIAKTNNNFNTKPKFTKILLIILLCIIILVVAVGISYLITVIKEKNTNTSNSLHGIIIKDSAEIKGSFGRKYLLKEGDNVYILAKQINNNDESYYKVKWNDKVGKVKEDDVAYFTFDNKNPYALMSDVSQFNYEKQFNNTEEYEVFLIKNSINYVYIRAGGRGYGKAGNLYTDSNYKTYIDACEYLGIPYGFYYIDEALNDEEITEEVNFIKDFISENATSMNKLPVAIDLEYQDGEGRTDNIWNERADILNKLIKEFNKENIDTIVYANYKRAKEHLLSVNAYFWVAYYNEDDKIPTKWEIESEPDAAAEYFKKKIIGWQFSENGAKEDGINTLVDLSLVKNNTHYFSTND